MSGKTTDQDLSCLGLINQPQGLLVRIWRACTVSFAYVLFALGCLVLTCAVPWMKLTRSTRADRTKSMRNFASRLARYWLRYCRWVDAVDVRVRNRDIRGECPGLLVANHPSLVDAIWIIASLPDVCCVLKGDLERSWLFRVLASNLGYVSNRDPEQLLAEGTHRLQSGETLLVFPEATRTAHGTLPQFRLGAAEMAIRSGVAVYPIVIHKRDPYLGKGMPWHGFPDQTMQWEIVFHAKYPAPTAPDPRLARRMLSSELEAFFHRELSRPTVAHHQNQSEN